MIGNWKFHNYRFASKVNFETILSTIETKEALDTKPIFVLLYLSAFPYRDKCSICRTALLHNTPHRSMLEAHPKDEFRDFGAPSPCLSTPRAGEAACWKCQRKFSIQLESRRQFAVDESCPLTPADFLWQFGMPQNSQFGQVACQKQKPTCHLQNDKQ